MATSPDGQLTFEQVLAQVLAADPESFYTQAHAFEEASKTLQDAKSSLAKHRRTLEDAWANGSEQRFGELDGLVRHLQVLLADVPTYPGKLRSIGDAIVDSRQRLLDLQHLPADADKHAKSDRDKRARKILEDLSSTYRRVGGEMPELPERSASGQLLTAPPPRQGMAFGSANGGGGGCPTTTKKSTHSLSRTAAAVMHAPPEEAVAQPAPEAAFGRFAQYATRPTPHSTPAPKKSSFNGFSSLTDQADQMAPAMRPGGTSLFAPEITENRGRRHADNVEIPLELDGPTNVSNVDHAAPAKLESSPAPVAPAPAAAVTAPAVPETTSAPTSVSKVQISVLNSSSLASVPTAPPVQPVVAPPAPQSPVVPPAAASGPQPHPLAMSATTNLAPDSAPGANMMRPSLGGVVPPSVSGPVGRGSEVWLRADSAEWTATHQVTAHQSRDDTHDRRLGFTGDKNAAEQGKDAR
jgi:hypothetical protein